MIILEADAEQGAPDALQRIATLAALLREQQAAVERLEADLQVAKEAARRTETEDLPQLMSELGLSEIKLTDGSKVEVKSDITCGISEERRPQAHRWLEERGFGGLIKTTVAVPFGRDERELAIAAARTVAETLGREVALNEAVHPNTLKAFLKEQLELGPDGSSPPAELFGIYEFNRAKLTAPKAPLRRK